MGEIMSVRDFGLPDAYGLPDTSGYDGTNTVLMPVAHTPRHAATQPRRAKRREAWEFFSLPVGACLVVVGLAVIAAVVLW
jgi:hypothetical protein